MPFQITTEASVIVFVSLLFLLGGIILLLFGFGVIQSGEGGNVTFRIKPGVQTAMIGIAGILIGCGGIILSDSPMEPAEGKEPTSTPVVETPIIEGEEAITAFPTATFIFEPTNPPPTPRPSSTPTPQLLSPASIERVSFCGGCTSHALITDLGQGDSRGYVLGIQAGQTLHVSTDKEAMIKILDERGNALNPNMITSSRWELEIPTTGDYRVILGGYGHYTITFFIPPLGSN